MKKALTQTIIVFVAVNLITAGFVLAQNAPDEASREEAIAARKQAEVVRVEAEIAAKAIQKEAETARKQLEAEQKEMQAVRKQLQAQLSQVAEQKEEEMKAAKKQLEAQLDQLLAEQKQLALQIPEIEIAAPRIPLLGHSGGGAVLVIPAAQMKVEDFATITEDMSVMSRIFAKKLNQSRLATGRGSWYEDYDPYDPLFGRDNGTIEAVYLEGYAALFLMKVNFPLSPTPEAKEEKETEEEDTDPLWTQTKQEMYAPEEAGRRLRRPRTARPEEKYDAEKVEELKETLIKTLKHAANIRSLKPDQSVILTVIGGRSQSGTTTTRLYGRSSGAPYDSSRSDRRSRSSYSTTTPRGAESGSFLPTVLTICAKKSDIDDFAKGELSFDQFRERTKIFISYAKVGQVGYPGVEERPVAQARPPVF